MRTAFFASALFTLAAYALSAPAAELTQGVVYSEAGGICSGTPAAKFKGHLLPAMLDYATALCTPGQERAAEHARRVAIDLARRFPEEVNDLHLQRPNSPHPGSWATPLSLAVQAQDRAMVSQLLRLGARPLTINAGETLLELPLLPGVKPEPRVAELLHLYGERFNPLLALMPKGARSPQYKAPFAELPPARKRLAENFEHTYLGEPGELNDRMLYEAYRRLNAPRDRVLQVQPLTRLVTQPAPQGKSRSRLYASVCYTGRIVRAIKGKAPEQELVSWSVAHEGPVEGAVDGELVQLPPDAEPVVIDTCNYGHGSPGTAEGNTLRLGAVDPFATFHGHDKLRAFEKVVADYPEILETTAATAEELAAARELMEQAPCLVRATITEQRVEVDDKAGTATLHCRARLRDPLRGALIIGALRDWSDIRYARSLPLTEALRRAAAAGSTAQNIPAILIINTENGSRSVRQSFDAVHDAAMLRALNEAAFMP